MLLTLLLIVQVCGAVHGGIDLTRIIKRVKLNDTCTAIEVKVTPEISVARYCYVRCNNTEYGPKFSDGRPCTFDPNSEVVPVRSTGKCFNGICRSPDNVPIETMQKPLCRPYETTPYKDENIATKCKQWCFVQGSNTSRQELNVTNGVKCVYETKPSWHGFSQGVAQVGTCQNGTCSTIKLTNDCERKKLAIYSAINVDEKCTLTCGNGQPKQLDNGTMCALRSKRSGWISWLRTEETRVQEIGVCMDGQCVQREQYTVRPHESDTGCCGTDFFIHKNMTVASHCMAQCNDGKTEPREEGIWCLFQYRHVGSHNMFILGTCHCGICEPQDNSVVLTDYQDPTKEPMKPASSLPESCQRNL